MPRPTNPVVNDGIDQENYRVIPALNKALPRVTSILSFNPNSDGDALLKWREQWKKDNPHIVQQCLEEGIDPDKFHAWRGTQCHSCLENGIQGLTHPSMDHPFVKPFWDKIRPDVEAGRFSNPIWSEGPKDTYDWPNVDFSFERNGETHYHLWSEELGCVGTPDLAVTYGVMDKKLTLFDLKTSTSRYSSKPPRMGGKNHSGFYKYMKTMTQLAFYDLMFKELVPQLTFQQWGIIVLPENSDTNQLFFLNNPDSMEKFREKAREKVRQFYEYHSRENVV